MAHLWLHQLLPYTGMSEGELSYCIVHLGFPLPRPAGAGGLRWATWEVDRWMRSQGERTAA